MFRSRKAQNLEGQRDDSFIHSLVHSFFLSFFPRLPLIQHTVEDRLLCAEHGGSLERPNTALAPGPRAGWRCHRRASASGTHRNTQAHPASAAEPGLDIPSGATKNQPPVWGPGRAGGRLAGTCPLMAMCLVSTFLCRFHCRLSVSLKSPPAPGPLGGQLCPSVLSNFPA